MNKPWTLDLDWPGQMLSPEPPPEPVRWPDRPEPPSDGRARQMFFPEDWLGLKALDPLKVERVYAVDAKAAPLDELPEVVGFKRELMGWQPEIPLAEIRIRCRPRARDELLYEYRVVTPLEEEEPDARWPLEPCCSDRDLIRFGSRVVRVRDRRIHNVPTFLDIERQRFRCNACRKVTAEDLPDVHFKYRMTTRLHRDIALGSVKRPFAEVAALQSVGVDTVERIFHDYQAVMLKDYEIGLPAVIGVDEVKLLGEVCFVCSDLTNGRILDIVKGNSKNVIERFFKNNYHRSNVRVVCQDMHRPYRQAATKLFPKAVVVVDRFHVIQCATKAMDEARIAFGAGLPREDRTRLSRLGRLFNRNAHTLTPAQRIDLDAQKAGSPLLAQAHELKEAFGHIYTRTDRATAEAAFETWADKLRDPAFAAGAPYFRPLERTVRNWHREIFAFFDMTVANGFDRRVTNAFVEGLNRVLREINRDAHGLTLATLRAKAVLRHGHFHTMDELVSFNLRGVPPDEVEGVLNHRIWSGFSPDDLAESLRSGGF